MVSDLLVLTLTLTVFPHLAVSSFLPPSVVSDQVNEPPLPNTNEKFLVVKRNDSSFVVMENPNYVETTERPPSTAAPVRREEQCPREVEGVPICVGLMGELTQLKNTSCWYTKPYSLEKDMVVAKLVVYSVLLFISVLGNIYIVLVGVFDWFLNRQAFCQGLVALAVCDLFIVCWYYSEDILTARLPVEGYWPMGEVGCVCREMFVNIVFATLMFIIVILFYERKHEAVVAEAKMRLLKPQMSRMQRQISGVSHASTQGILVNIIPPPPLSPVAIGLEDDEVNNSGTPPCCMGSQKAKLRAIGARQMIVLILVVLVVSFTRGILFANALKYSECAITDGTLLPTCEPDNLGYYEKLGMFLGDAVIVYVLPVVLICYYSKNIFYRLYMPYHRGDQTPGYPERSKKFILMTALAMLTFVFLLPERAIFIFVKVTKISFDLPTAVFIRMLIYLNCAFKPLLYGLLYQDIYYPLLILILGMPDSRKPPVTPSPQPLHTPDAEEEEEPSMTQEEYERRLAEEDPTKPSKVMIEVLREKVKKQKEREEKERERLSSMCSSNNSLMFMRQGSDPSNGSGGIFFAPNVKNFNTLRAPIMGQPPYMMRSSSCSDPYPYMDRPKLHSVSGAADQYGQQTLPRNPVGMFNNIYTMDRAAGLSNKKGAKHTYSNQYPAGVKMQPTEKLLSPNRSTEIPYFSQQNVYSTSPRKHRNSKSESLSAHGYDNMPTSQRIAAASTNRNPHKQRVHRSSSKRSSDEGERMDRIDASPNYVEGAPPSPSAGIDTPIGRLGEERSSSSSNGSACTEVTNVSAVSLTTTAAAQHHRLSSNGSNASNNPTPPPPCLPPRSPTGVLMFETINEQSPFDFSNCSST